jgi:hypothetical protein
MGYIGDYCSSCEDEYWRDGYSCKACADSVVSNYWHAMTAMIVFFGVVGLCCALLPLESLTRVVGFILDAQLLSIILSAATPYIDEPKGLVDALEVLGMMLGIFNIEISIFKPGCGFPDLSFTMQVYATLACFVVVSSGFLVLCIFRIPLLWRARWLHDVYTTRVQPRLPGFPACLRRRQVETRSLMRKTDGLEHPPGHKTDKRFAGSNAYECA